MNKENLKNNLVSRGILVTDHQIEQLISFMKITLETNEKFNLTAIKDEETFLEKMIFDSALTLVENDLSGKRVLDLGTGAGFPGVVMYILNPEIKLTLLDSTKKKIDYLREFCKTNGYNIECVAARAEDYAKKNRETYDLVVSRAVSELNILLELSIPMIKVDGELCALKAKGIEEEISNAKGAFKKLDCHLERIYEDTLPECDEYRALVYIKKDKETNKKYPRDFALIKDKPL